MVEKQLDLDEITELLKGKHYRCYGEANFFQPFELKAWDFLAFAKQDLAGNSDRELANTLSNVHRSINCRVDELLWSMMLKTYSAKERWDYDYGKKVQVLQSLGIPIRRVLTKLIRDIRNQLEHRYERPKSQEQVQNALEVGEYFLEATDRYLDGTYGAIGNFYIEGGEWPRSGKEPIKDDYANLDDYHDALEDYTDEGHPGEPGPELYHVSFDPNKDTLRLDHWSRLTEQTHHSKLQLPEDCSIETLMEFIRAAREVIQSPISYDEVQDIESYFFEEEEELYIMDLDDEKD